jgi:hypothetical protein
VTPLEIRSSLEAREMLAHLGRTEDLKFSPSKKLLAIAGFDSERVIIFKVNLEASKESPRINLSDYFQIFSPMLKSPHGLVFLDERTLIVANRAGAINVFTLPVAAGKQQKYTLDPVRTIGGGRFRKLDSPGSVDAYPMGWGVYRVLICNNYAHHVTSARIIPAARHLVWGHQILLEKSLEIPDGINVSENRKWIVVSNHVSGTLFMYENQYNLGRRSEPVAVLHGMDCPHGVRFTDNDQKLIVVDSAAPNMCVYATGSNGWKGDYFPVKTMRVLDDQTFELGRYNLEEGGPKGIDLDPVSNVLAMTCEHQPLTFYSLDSILQETQAG